MYVDLIHYLLYICPLALPDILFLVLGVTRAVVGLLLGSGLLAVVVAATAARALGRLAGELPTESELLCTGLG